VRLVRPTALMPPFGGTWTVAPPPPPPPPPSSPTVPAALVARVVATPALAALAGRVTEGLAPPGAETPYACLFPIAAPDEATTGTAYIRRWQYQATLFDDDPGRLAVLREAWVETFGRRSPPLATADGRTFQVRSILGPTIVDARDQSLRGLPLWRQVITVIVAQGRRWPA
jgi:hypothetical protein